MSEQIRIQHQNYSISELSKVLDEESMPVRRGVHVGNQEPIDLVVECNLPSGVDVLAADTINGNDREAKPRYIKLAGGNISIAPERLKNKVVGMIPVMEDAHSRLRDHDLAERPMAGESVSAFHMRVIDALQPANQPVLVSEFFAAHRQLYEQTMQSAYKNDELSRMANSAGAIRDSQSPPQEVGVFGLQDKSSPLQGLLPSLNVMMAMDILTAIQKGADASMHLGGSGMALYSKDPARMFAVSRLVDEVRSELDLPAEPYTYLISDISSLADDVDTSSYISQHELLRDRGEVLV